MKLNASVCQLQLCFCDYLHVCVSWHVFLYAYTYRDTITYKSVDRQKQTKGRFRWGIKCKNNPSFVHLDISSLDVHCKFDDFNH